MKPIQKLLALLLLPPPLAMADWSYEGDITSIAQTSNQSALNADAEISADAFIFYTHKKWQATMHLEAASTPGNQSVMSQIGESNADAFSIATSDNGAQISEAFVSYHYRQNTQIHFGQIDATAYLDTNAGMNDENTQFIASSLVNNPTIDFPDYTLGVALQTQFHRLPTTIVIANGEGLADNPTNSYATSLELDVTNKGLFQGIEQAIINDPIHQLSVGAWLHSGNHQSLKDASKDNLYNYGLYLNGAHQLANTQFSFRAGWARPETSEISQFYSLGVQHDYDKWQAGVAYGYSVASSESPLKDQQTLEIYGRYQPLDKELYLTPSVQWLNQAAQDNPQIEQPVFTYNLRVSYLF